MEAMIMQSRLLTIANYISKGLCLTYMPCLIHNMGYVAILNGHNSTLCLKSVPFPRKSFRTSRHLQQLAFALDTGGVSSNGGGDNLDDGNESNLGRTRLGRLVSAGARQLLEKLNSARKNFPTKIFLLLLGFYTANALATILGQTGDWDVLVAGVVVAAIEWIGILMYKKPPPLLTRRLKSLIVLINYWKAGVCLGLFVDAFKLGS
ncbi:ycf20-like protein [Cucurbita pepo subsp. pepo]|uniref:ycf20-like protein n=1 Tax=Cucurbita pepo subsp. pepo TaxID=3664 RepID=UPI000C9DA2E3|nr:ycf20-like protein [Cucurbita pepo subsp. pepo]XP_023520637.1 ycf20-like protein [Cucurbita pepo subsp. pepo]XP_023520638.1 ycf20-like protein [Cucurbita pepo subsp. pepo]XP_023520639.1 ycf20-like protein [Cucurbita pepo subsp. pepo]XP_023520640.1 ycf20-like protein [Cucurbita pepo subsp. pepo]